MATSREPARATNSAAEVAWLHYVRREGVVSYRMGKQGRSLIAEWPRIARLTCDESGNNARLVPKAGTSKASLNKLRGVVRAMLGDLRGGIGVHASAFALGRRAVVLLGDSGAGKSTTAAEFCLRHGGRLLADDAALLEERGGIVLVAPSEDRHYLTESSAQALDLRLPEKRVSSGKAAVRPPRAASRGYRLALVVSLRYDDTLAEAVCRPLVGVDAAMRILPSMFRFDVGNRRKELQQLTRVYAQARVFEVARPRRSPGATAAILNLLEMEASRGR